MDLSTSLQFVKGIGPARGEMLAAKGLATVADLLYYAPFRYEDRRNVKAIAELAVGEKAVVLARVESAKLSGFRRPSVGLFEAEFHDGSGQRLQGRWFHGERYADTIKPNARMALFGKVETGGARGMLLMVQPEIEVLPEDSEEDDERLHSGRIVPVYEAAGRVSTRVLRLLIHRILKEVQMPADVLPESIRQRLVLPPLGDALREIHAPSADADLNLLNSFRTGAQRRLIFDEFFWLECGLVLKKARAKRVAGVSFTLKQEVRDQIRTMLPFKPTGAQKRVVQEIADDMKQPFPMNRLLQGDVGSGKTIVAAQAAVIAVENGYQTAVLAPTEILATQHYLYFKRLLGKLNYTVVPLTGSTASREKTQVKEMIRSGRAQVAVGTHAMIQEDVEFARLGLAIVDEQHRFGVLQRLKLMQKGIQPDVLVMTATPIPRTLALTMYGDLDVSIIDELPPGRQPIVTKHVRESSVETVYRFLRQEVEAGHQAYVVYPVVEESEALAMKAAVKMHEHLSQVVFPGIAVDLLHGRMAAAEKDLAMRRFQSAETKILVSTTVIEVGVDVPNATVMVVEQAERFGLAQLHQLRGRVGRGREQSYCILVTGKQSELARERIQTLVSSNDGFYIADMDMQLRGPGEFFGTRQSGLPVLRFADLTRDADILELARSEAQGLFQLQGASEQLRHIVRYIQEHWQRRYGYVQVG